MAGNNTVNFNNKNGLGILSWNMNGMKTNYSIKCNELQTYIDNSSANIDIICIQETKLIKNQTPFKFKGYQKPVYKNRLNATHPGGGVCIYVKNDITFKDTSKASVSDIEFISRIFLEIQGNEHKVSIYNLYARCSRIHDDETSLTRQIKT